MTCTRSSRTRSATAWPQTSTRRWATVSSSTRCLLARIEGGEAGQSRTEVLATAGAARLVRAVPIQTAPTGSLEGVLTDAAAGAPASARVRITTEGGRYLPPEKHTYGLI